MELLHGLVAPSELVSAVETAVESYCVDSWWKWVLQRSKGQFEPAQWLPAAPRMLQGERWFFTSHSS